jgi:hypothetical protein
MSPRCERWPAATSCRQIALSGRLTRAQDGFGVQQLSHRS